MDLTVLSVGRPRDRALAQACQRYLQRCRPTFRARWETVAEGDPRGSRLPKRAVAAEGQRLLRRLGGSAVDVALAEEGRQRSSLDLARWLADLRDDGRAVRLVVGGAHGLAPEVLSRCGERLSLSAMTLPHELALLVLCEQLYRASTIVRGEPYHHA